MNEEQINKQRGAPAGSGLTPEQGQSQGRVDSASDERTVNNLMRHEYRVLSAEEKKQMKALKDAGASFVELLHAVGGTDRVRGEDRPEDARQTSRELAIAQTKIEEAVMWAVKHVTK